MDNNNVKKYFYNSYSSSDEIILQAFMNYKNISYLLAHMKMKNRRINNIFLYFKYLGLFIKFKFNFNYFYK